LRFGLIASPNQHNRRPNQNKTRRQKKQKKQESFQDRAGRKEQEEKGIFRPWLPEYHLTAEMLSLAINSFGA